MAIAGVCFAGQANAAQDQLMMPEQASAPMTVNEPVSYTHLDVYKRQASTYQPLNSNNNGYKYNRGTTVSGEMHIRGTAGNHVAYAITPRADLFAGDNSARLVNGYVKTHIGTVEVQAGKDELWWGPMHQSSLNPVSYTHLDVYKRQQYTRRMSGTKD